jgi:D-alanine-D-alanine ligase
MSGALRHVVIAYETEAAAAARLVALGHAPEIALEIAVYLAQSTDLPAFMPDIEAALAEDSVSVAFVELDDLPAALAAPGFDAGASLLWNLTDGIRYYRGSAAPALARMLGVPRFGSPPAAQHVCQDKFQSLAIALAAGLPCPPTLLLRGEETLGAIGEIPTTGPFFVKPNTLGAKIGIFADSRCDTLDQARERAARLWRRYRDRAVVQPFIPGEDVRVSFLDTGRDFREQLGIFRLLGDPRGEAGGAFMTMKDNDTLSGIREAAFEPAMRDLRGEPGRSPIEHAAARLARLLSLAFVFSMDFRIDRRSGEPYFLEFEVCPAVTIHDFQSYLHGVHGLALGPALARSFQLAHARAGGLDEA